MRFIKNDDLISIKKAIKFNQWTVDCGLWTVDCGLWTKNK